MLRCLSKHKEWMCHFHLSINWGTLIQRKAALFSVTDTQIHFLPISSDAVYHKEQDRVAVRMCWLLTTASCCLYCVASNPTIPVVLSSLPVSRWELQTPAEICVNVCMFVSVCAHQGACCASIFAATSLMNLQRATTCNHSCLVLSILFHVFSFLVSFLLFSCWYQSLSTCSGYTCFTPKKQMVQ